MDSCCQWCATRDVTAQIWDIRHFWRVEIARGEEDQRKCDKNSRHGQKSDWELKIWEKLGCYAPFSGVSKKTKNLSASIPPTSSVRKSARNLNWNLRHQAHQRHSSLFKSHQKHQVWTRLQHLKHKKCAKSFPPWGSVSALFQILLLLLHFGSQLLGCDDTPNTSQPQEVLELQVLSFEAFLEVQEFLILLVHTWNMMNLPFWPHVFSKPWVWMPVSTTTASVRWEDGQKGQWLMAHILISSRCFLFCIWNGMLGHFEAPQSFMVSCVHSALGRPTLLFSTCCGKKKMNDFL